MSAIPTFSEAPTRPGPYGQVINGSLPGLQQSGRAVGIAGQGAKTLPRTQSLMRGSVPNGQDGPLTFNTVINLTNVQDANGVIYRNGIDYQLVRTDAGVQAVVDWSLEASLIGSVVLSTLSLPTALNGLTFTLAVNGTVWSVVFTNATTPAAIASQINAWVGATIATVNGGGYLVLTANNLLIYTSQCTLLLGFSNGQSASVNQPAAGVLYTVSYISDKQPSEYEAQAFLDINSLLSAYGPLNPFIALFTGNATSSTANTVVAAGTPGWTSNQWTGYYLKIHSGTGTGQVRVIISNTANTLTLSQAWTQYNYPDATSGLLISQYNANGISRGAWAQYKLGTSMWVASQYEDDIFNQANMQGAIDAFGETTSGLNPEIIVLMHDINPVTEQNIISYLQSRVDTDGSVLSQGKVKAVVLGLISGTNSPLTYSTLSAAIEDKAVFIAGNSNCPIDFGVGAGVESLGGAYWAALICGAYCSVNNQPWQTLKQFNLGVVADLASFVDPFDSDEIAFLEGAGIITIVQNGVNLVIEIDASTNQTTDLNSYLSYFRRTTYVLKQTLAFTGPAIAGQTLVVDAQGQTPLLNSIEAGLNHIYGLMQNPQAQVLYSFDNVDVVQDPEVNEQIDTSGNFEIDADVVWILSNLTMTVGNASAVA